MKIKFTLIFTALLLCTLQVKAQRYVTEIFTDVNVTTVQYATNITVISGAPAPENLYVNIYTPVGDSETDRPLVLLAHTGSFLPLPLNGSTTGDTLDYAVKTICTRLAKMGYVAAVFTYRKGWNPGPGTTVEQRRSGLINAAYRGIQDFRSLVRFFRKSVAEMSNPYGIDPAKIAGWGQGTGGYIVSASACLQLEEIYIDKFKNPSTGIPYIDTTLLGNLDGTTAGLINLPNTPGYPSNISLSFNAGGALGDSSWLDAGEPPMIAAHVIQDPFAPFGYILPNGPINCEGDVIVPTTGDFVVKVAGSKCLINRANSLGINDVLNAANFNDPINAKIATEFLAEPNLWPIWTAGPQAGPWDYWDQAYYGQLPHPSCMGVMPPDCSFNTINLATNPDMSLDKANRYIDTLLAFFAPRAHLVMNGLSNSEEIITDVNLSVYPNPSQGTIWVEVKDARVIEGVEILDLHGKTMGYNENIGTKAFQVERNGLSAGMYILKVRFKDGIATRKIMFN